MPLTNKVTLANLQVGDYVWCKYAALTSGQFGSLSDIATKTDADVSTQLIPVASSATPNGYFKFIKVGTDFLGRDILCADRNIQHSISWDTLNTAGVASGSGFPYDNDIIYPASNQMKFTVRLLTGGVTSTDKDNEWDKYIVNSTLNGAVVAGDNTAWNWSGIYSWSSTTITSNSANRVLRGNSSLSMHGSTTSSTVSVTGGFRPVLVIETLFTTKYLINDGGSIKTYKNSAWSTLGSGNPTRTMFETDGMDELWARSSKVFSNNMTNDGALGSGKVFQSTVDLQKYFELLGLNVR